MKKLLIYLTVILAATYSIPIVFNESILFYYGDSIETVYPYFVHLTEQVRNGQFFHWNYYMGFGTNNFVNFFNGLGSPFIYLASFFSNETIPFLILYFDIIRFYLIAIFAWLWATKLYSREDTRIIFSLLFTFTGWALQFIHFGFYLDAYLYLPLFIYSSEELIQGRKQWLFPLSIVLLAFSSPYFLYMQSFFLLIYHIFRFGSQSNLLSRDFFKAFYKVFLYYLLGVGLSAIVLLPEIYIVSTSPRIGSSWFEGNWVYDSAHRMYNFVTSFYSPVLNDYNPNVFFSRYKGMDNSMFYLYTSMLSLSILPQILFVKFKERKALILLIGVLILFSFFPFMNFVLNGNDHVRWHFMISIAIIIATAYLIDTNTTFKTGWLGLFNIPLLIVFYNFSLSRDYIDFEFQRIHFNLLILLVVLVGLYIFLNSFTNTRKYVIWILSIELMFLIFLRMHLGLVPRYIQEVDFEALNKLRFSSVIGQIETQSDFVRIDVSESTGNVTIANNFQGFNFYSSLYNHEIRSLLDERFTSGWNMSYAPSKFVLKHLLNSQYFVTNTGIDNVPFGFEKRFNLGDFDVYEQTYLVNFAKVFQTFMSRERFLTYDKSLQDYILSQMAVVDKNDNQLEPEILPKLLHENFINEYIDYTDLSEGYLILDYSGSNPYARCQIDEYRNNNYYQSEEFEEYGYQYRKIDLTLDGVFVYCRSIYNQNEYIPLNVYFVTNEQLSNLYSLHPKKPSLETLEISGDEIRLMVDVSVESGLVFIPIAYDKGWRLYSGDSQLHVEKVQDGFIGFRLERGQHELVLKYQSPYFLEGRLVSISSVLIYISLNLKKMRKSKKIL